MEDVGCGEEDEDEGEEEDVAMTTKIQKSNSCQPPFDANSFGTTGGVGRGTSFLCNFFVCLSSRRWILILLMFASYLA